MGLTITYNMESSTRSAKRILDQVEQMRAIALTLPLASVSPIRHKTAQQISEDLRSEEGGTRWDAICSCLRVQIPWVPKGRQLMTDVYPEETFWFTVDPGEGSETCVIGLCRYPKTTVAEYSPEHDARFTKLIKDDGRIRFEFDCERYHRFTYRKFGNYQPMWTMKEQRTINTGLAGRWRHSDFCKTQYASDPSCGGAANFLKCHISLISLLETVGQEVKGVKVGINDAGHFGPSTYSEDYQEAYAAKREPTYLYHAATHSVAKLLTELGENNTIIAALAGSLKDAWGKELEAPILSYPNFEQLEFQGRDGLKPLLKILEGLRPSSS